MKASDLELYVGVVVDADDPKHLCRVKAVAPGLFDNSTMDIEDMYWVHPFTAQGYQRVSKPVEGQKIWIINDTTNEYGYWYLPYPELNINTTACVQSDDTDVIVSRSGAGVGYQMYYNRDEGFVTRSSTEGCTQMLPNGDIKNTSNGSVVSQEGGQVFVGEKDGEAHQMVLGDKLVKLLGDLAKNLSNLSVKASSFWATAGLAQDFATASSEINNALQEIVANKSFIRQ